MIVIKCCSMKQNNRTNNRHAYTPACGGIRMFTKKATPKKENVEDALHTLR